MTTLIDLMRQPSIAALAWALIHFLWQGALLGAGAFVILRATRDHRASTRYLISAATLAAMLLTFITTFLIEIRMRPMENVTACYKPKDDCQDTTDRYPCAHCKSNSLNAH